LQLLQIFTVDFFSRSQAPAWEQELHSKLKDITLKTIWKYQEAERHLGKIIKSALSEGPQYVTQQEIGTVVIISAREYEHLVSDKLDFVDFLLSCPKTDINFETERQRDFSRNIEL